jgi:hypothetical protein
VIKQNLIIYKFDLLYHILKELDLELNYKIIFADTKISLNDRLIKSDNSLVITNTKHLDIGKHFVLENTPINFFKIIEKINIEFLKIKFGSQSKMRIKSYTIDLNSREIIKNNNKKLKMTEREIDIIIYLFKSEKPVSIEELQNKVWSYNSDMETHTVETHIYRLRKKILNNFDDKKFIISKNNGYQIK